MDNFGESNICPICRDEIDFYSYGRCDHPTCARCAIKLRRFGSIDEPEFSKCATCRARLTRVIIMTKFTPFEDVDLSLLSHDVEFDFLFENEEVQQLYQKMLSCVCSVCGYTAASMSALNRHTTNEHCLSFCDLCLRHARLLPCEFVPLSGEQLAIHRKWDNEKKRGHPVCEFCTQTFYEFEDLVKHIREVHFLCDFCHSVAVFEVFRRQRELFDHYKAAHFVCPECEVVGRMTCYASNDQLGLHRMHEHPNESQGDPSLWEPLQIRFSTHGLISQHANTRNNRRTAYAHEGGDEEAPPPESYNSQSRGPMPEEWTAMDFPSLSGGPPSSQEKQATSKPHRRTGRSLASVVGSGHSVLVNSEDFPSLPSSSTTSSAPPQPQKDWAAEKRVAASSASEKQPAGSQRDVLPPSREDFPSLAGGGTSTNTPATNWSAKVSSSAAVVAGNPAKQRHQPVPTENDFPSLSASNGSSNSLVSGGKPLLPPYHPPSKDNQQPKSTKGKKNNRLTEPPPQPAPDLLPFSPSIDKARKSRWWNEADNSGALARLNLNEEGSTSTNAHILVVDSLEPVVSSSESVPKKPVDFSINEFPSLCGDKKANAKAVPKAPKTKTKVSQPPKKKVAPSTEGSVKTTSLDDVEDTETVLFKDNIYTQPQHYAEKNRELIRVAQETLSNSNVKNSFSRFADLSRLFRHGQLTAQAYVQGLDGLFGRMGDADEAKDGQFHWLSSMIALLPEVGLQRALLRALRGAAAPRVPHCASPARAHAVAPPPWAKLVTSRLQTCSSCGQVCLRSEMKDHTDLAHS